MKPVEIHDIKDAEQFVRAQIVKGRLRLTQDEMDELTAEGLLIMVKLANSYQPGHGGRDPANSRFSGYAAKYLPGKLSDAWHRMQEGHRLSTRQDGKREWVYDQPAVSLNIVAGHRRSDTHDTPAQDPANHVTALQIHDALHTDMATDLAAALDHQWQHERQITLHLGILLGLGYTIPQAIKHLGIRSTEAKDALERIRRASHHLQAA